MDNSLQRGSNSGERDRFAGDKLPADGDRNDERAAESTDPQRQLNSPELVVYSIARDLHPAVSAGQSDEATLAVFLSGGLEPTHVSIQRSTSLPSAVQDEVRFCADHNYDGIRHSLTCLLTTYNEGAVVLCGQVRELFTTPLLSGSDGPAPAPQLVWFELEMIDAKGSSGILGGEAFRLVEEFSETGVWGLNARLESFSRELEGVRALITRSLRLEQQLVVDLSEPLTTGEAEEKEGGMGARRGQFSERQLERLRAIESPLLDVHDISMEQFRILRGELQSAVVQEYRGPEDGTPEPPGSGFEAAEPRLQLLHGRWWMDFFSPDVPSASGVIFSIRLPRLWLMPSQDLSCLRIEVAGPKNRLGLRERYVVDDVHNVLGLNEIVFNRELFRALFHELHAVNEAECAEGREVAALVQVLEEHGLQARPIGFRATLKALLDLFRAPFASKNK